MDTLWIMPQLGCSQIQYNSSKIKVILHFYEKLRMGIHNT